MSEVLDTSINSINVQNKVHENVENIISENGSNLEIVDELINYENNNDDNNDKISHTSVDILLENTLIELLKTYFRNEQGNLKIDMTINDDVIRVIHHIIEFSPDIFSNIEKSIVDIIRDEQINSNDIPHLLVIIKELYKLIHSLKKIKVSAKQCIDITASILKCVIHILILEGKVHVKGNNQEDFLSKLNLLIDSCVELLGYAQTLNNNCFSCFGR